MRCNQEGDIEMETVSQSDEQDEENCIEEDSRVFGPNGFGVVTYVNRDVGEALVDPIRIDELQLEAYPLEELELAYDEEWPIYNEVPGGEVGR